MEFDAFSSDLGRSQGRVALPGDLVRFVLGAIEAGRFAELTVGDYAEVAQNVDLTGVDLVRVAAELGVPSSAPPGLAWELSILVDGAKQGRLLGTPGKVRSVTDLVANVSKLSGVHAVAVRLELVRS